MFASTRRLTPAAIAVPLLLMACSGGPAAPASVVPSPAASGAGSTELVADVDMGDRTLHLVCLGPTDTGEPTIVFESGLGGAYTAWGEILLAMQGTHRLCAYDRAGLGASPAAPEASRTAADSAADLATLLETSGIDGAKILVAHSVGAWNAALYTQSQPDDVVGVVLVDPRAPGTSDALRDALPAKTADEPSSLASLRDELGDFEMDPSLNDEHLALAESGSLVAAALDADGPLFGDRPVVVLQGGKTTDNWADLPP
ncbi:MAG TPA: alpha/beta hydrolase, partial [Candidatus Saccharimonadales bacterium]|nr:alpha/beta hydrolase [Candidatus Saccharimonadales bacterium]